MPTSAHTAGFSDLVGERRCQVAQRKSLSHVGGADFGEEYDADRLFCMLSEKGLFTRHAELPGQRCNLLAVQRDQAICRPAATRPESIDESNFGRQ